MSTQQIEKARWTEYFDHLSNVTDSQLVKIELVGMGIGDQTEIDHVDFGGMSYDAEVDTISVQAGSLGHNILHPIDVFVEERNEGLTSMQVTDAEDNKHILYFKAKS